MTFERLLQDSGCQVDEAGIVFNVEPILFRRKLDIKLHSESNLPDQFMEELQTWTEDPVIFRKFLLPSTLADNVPKTSRTSSSESLFKILLAIDSIQANLITYLLERLPEFYDELENDHSSSCTARLILHQLRWLDYIAQPEELTGKLIEIIQITPSIIQHELITSLPDIVNDSEHKPIVVYLKELMSENSELTVPILDALSNLTLHSESLEDVRELVLERLASAELDDLAVIIKFLLHTATPTTIDFVILGIRQKLDFRALYKIQSSQTQRQNKNKNSPEALILESIKLGLQFHKFVCESWIKSIAALQTQRDHKVIDMLVLIILYSMTSTKKKVEGMIKKKIINGSISTRLIEETINYHSDGLAGYWSTVLSLAENLLRSSQQNNVISPCANRLYISSFKATDAYYKQEIIGALVTHIGSGIEIEMNVALDVLLRLVKADVKSVIAYNVFIKGILDYLDNLNVYQIRTLFDIFSILALTTGNSADGSANLWSEIQTIIRKQLSNPREKYKNIGIIASLSAVKVLGSRELCQGGLTQSGEGSSSTQSRQHHSTVRHPFLRDATNLLELALRYATEYPNCIALIYDELSHLFEEGNIDERLLIWIKENMASDFIDFYVVALSDALEFIQEANNNGVLKLEPERQFSLDGEHDEIAVKMYELIYNPDIKNKKKKLTPMCSIFNLIQSCEKQLNEGSLAEVDALFGCSVIMFNADNLDEVTSEEIEYACDMLFYTINWFKELLNAFMFTREENFRARLISRLRSILEMEHLLAQLMKQVSNYAPLEFHHNVPVITNETMSSLDPEDRMVKKETKSHASIRFANVEELRPYTRAFDIHILEILKYNEELENTEEKMTIDEVNYILEDLNQKLNIKIAPPPVALFGKKKNTNDEKHATSNTTMLARMNSKKLMKKVVHYLPSILQTLENLYSEVQSRDIEPGRIQGSENLALAISHIFHILFKLISWPDIQNSDNTNILKQIIHAIASRISGEAKVSPQQEIKQAFQYLSNFSENIPQATTAVLLFKVIQRLMVLTEESGVADVKEEALRTAKQIMTTNWFDWRDIKKDISFLFEQTIELSSDPLEVLYDFVNRVLLEFESDQELEDYPLLKEETMVSHCQGLINQTVKAFELFKNTDEEADEDVVIVQNARIVKIFERITNYIKIKEHKLLLGVLLRTGRIYIDHFTKYSIPYFTRIFKTHSNEIVSIFKDFQTSTRVLQILCSHVKVLKEVQLSSYVPPLKKALEVVIYQVKMLLTENRIPSSAFFMGALKHRDIHGAEVSSQIPRENLSEDEEMMDEDQIEEDSSRDRSPPKKKERKKKKAVEKPDILTQKFRTSSVVPSSSDEEEEPVTTILSDEESAIQHHKRKRVIETVQEDEEEENVIEFTLDSEEEEEELPKEPPQTKKRRLGIGRSSLPTQKKVFDLKK